MIHNYQDFVTALLSAGFSMSGGNDEGVFGLIAHGWREEPADSPLRWHTGDPEADPWEWRMRVLEERDDIAYGKVFFRKGGFITREWYPYFLAVRRGSKTLDAAYADGLVSRPAKQIYDALAANGRLPLEEIKRAAAFVREDKAVFDKALTELQMKLYVTVCGRQQRMPNGWMSTVLCTAEHFFGDAVFTQAAQLNADTAAQHIRAQILRLNPAAKAKKADGFILG